MRPVFDSGGLSQRTPDSCDIHSPDLKHAGDCPPVPAPISKFQKRGQQQSTEVLGRDILCSEVHWSWSHCRYCICSPHVRIIRRVGVSMHKPRLQALGASPFDGLTFLDLPGRLLFNKILT